MRYPPPSIAFTAARCAFIAALIGCDSPDSPDSPPEDRPVGDVAGLVIDGYGLPLASARVAIGSATTTTDEQGRFAFADIAAPYTVQVATPDGNFAIEYQAISRTDPTLTVPIGSDPDDTAVSVTFSGDVDTDGANRAMVVPVGEGFGFEGKLNTAEGNTSFGSLFAKHWQTPASVKLYGLQWDVATPQSISLWPTPTRYLAFGISDAFDLEPDANPVVPLSRAAVTGTTSLRGAITLPPGFEIGQQRLWIHFADNADMTLFFEAPTGLGIDVKTPLLGASAGDPTFGIEVFAAGPGGDAYAAVAGLDAGATGVQVAVTAPPSGLSAGGTFRWTKTAPVSWVSFRANESNAPSVWVVTAASATALPDFSRVGVVVPQGSSYRFGVAALAGLGDMDTGTAATGIADPWVRFTLGMSAGVSGGLARADEVVFTIP